jgi:hypothetical protein
MPAERVRARGFQVLAGDRVQALLDELLAGFRNSVSNMREPALTTAYGWLYHWYNVKGGLAFSPHLAREFLQHATANYYVNGKLRVAPEHLSVWSKGGEATATVQTNNPDIVAKYPWFFEGDPNGPEAGSQKRKWVSLETASERCGLAKETMRKLGVELGIIRKGVKGGSVVAIDHHAVMRLAKVLKESFNLNAAAEDLGVDWGTMKSFVKAGLVKPLISGGSSKHEYVFKPEDVRDFWRKVSGSAVKVSLSKPGLINSLTARRAYGVSQVRFFGLVLDGKLKAVERLSNVHGLFSLLVDRQKLLDIIRSVEDGGDVTKASAARALYAANAAIPKLVREEFLSGHKKNGELVICGAAIRKFRDRYIGLSEIRERTGGNIQGTKRHLANLGIIPVKKLLQCHYVGFRRRSVEPKIPLLKTLVRHVCGRVPKTRRGNVTLAANL